MLAFWAVLHRDLTLAFRHRAELANPMLFFLLIVSLYPLGIGPQPEILRTIAPGAVWIAALLAALLSLENLFRSDFHDGTLEQLLLSPHPLPLLISAKVLAHWLVSGLPLLLLAPVVGVLLNLPARGLWALLATLALGTPLLSLIGAIGTALTVGLRRGGILLTLLVLPLYIPVLIFATQAVVAAVAGMPIAGQLYFLAALLVLGLTLVPPTLAAAVRISLG
ncbi:heme exporter protein CcmB [Methylothermus subterraneus]